MTISRQLTVTGAIANGQAVQTLVPDAFNSRRRTSLVVYTHGAGESETAPTADALKTTVVQRLVDYGCVVVSCNAQGDNWGNPQSVLDHIATVNYAIARWRADDVFILSQSMGGLSGLSMFAAGTVANVRGWAGIYPATNLSAMFGGNAGGFAAAIRTAYGIAANGSDYSTKTAGSDPNLFTAATWSGKMMRMWASPSDVTVAKSTNADTLSATALSGGATEATVVACTGVHGDASHFQPTDLTAFMARCGMELV